MPRETALPTSVCMMSRSSRSSQFLKWVPLLGSGLAIFLGLVMLGGVIGLLWHPFKTWVVLDVHILGLEGDWIAWVVGFMVSAVPGFIAIVRRRTMLDFKLALTFLVLPVVSVAIMTQWYPVGAATLIGSGLLLSHALVWSITDGFYQSREGTSGSEFPSRLRCSSSRFLQRRCDQNERNSFWWRELLTFSDSLD